MLKYEDITPEGSVLGLDGDKPNLEENDPTSMPYLATSNEAAGRPNYIYTRATSSQYKEYSLEEGRQTEVRDDGGWTQFTIKQKLG